MKVGDLVRHKRVGKLALIIKLDVSAIDKTYRYPEFMWLDTGEIDSCAHDHLEVVS